MAAEVKAEQEPSIEEILESIRQIISEDGEMKPGGSVPQAPVAAKPAPQAPAPEKAAPVLSLTPEKDKGYQSDLDLSKAAGKDQGYQSDLDLSKAAGKDQGYQSDLDLSKKDDKSQSSGGAEPVLELTERIEPVVKDVPLSLSPQPQPVSRPAPPMMDKSMTDDSQTLMSSQTAAAASEALSKLLAGNVAIENEGIGRPGKVTLEEMTRELMKPMLKAWLDQNLTGIIEKMVQKEIEKLSRRAVDR